MTGSRNFQYKIKELAIHMTTDQRRYQVFISSTYLDLQAERQAIVSTLLESDAFPAGMEMFPAADDDAWALITSVIDDSDYYLLVIGGKYGSLDPTEDISFTEKEFNYARSTGKPVMAFLHGEPTALAVSQAEITEEARAKLQAFRDRVEATKHVKYWTSTEDLAGKVALSFNKMQRQTPAIGWVRGDRVASVGMLEELAHTKKVVAELKAELEAVQSKPPTGAENLSQGDDVVVVNFHAGAVLESGKTSVWIEQETTWNKLLGIVAPLLLTEASEDALKTELSETFSAQSRPRIIEELRTEAKIPTGKTVGEMYSLNVDIDDTAFRTILMQLKALGLTEVSNQRRSVTDKAVYWKLTALGEAQAVRQRAVQRPADGTPVQI
ncbi:DUF4062 domain-containing protein [Leucobacter sp. cx-42]|uniref:DUF4062 domain-containing protein n=1 Tax=unclassified Leucobacter TaxID=2621730 RepID=UPI00165E7949|nr:MULTISPECIES: DUF4062 domain-containing protein [unclassified Leucobacter]MBC9953399.1 DUF4062 domain-containing protein [Leucobacter sp. cx-42]